MYAQVGYWRRQPRELGVLPDDDEAERQEKKKGQKGAYTAASERRCVKVALKYKTSIIIVRRFKLTHNECHSNSKHHPSLLRIVLKVHYLYQHISVTNRNKKDR